MKKHTLYISSIIFALLFSTNIFAQLLLEENFDYPEGDLLTNHGWVAHSGAGSNPITVVSPGLTFPGQPGSGVGNAALIDNTGEDVHKLFTSVTSGAVYTSFMVQVTAADAAGYFLHYATNPHTTGYRARVWVHSSVLLLEFGLSFGSSGQVYTGFNYATDVTYLLIVKYEIVAGADNDLVSLYIFDSATPPTNTEPAVPTLGPFAASGTSEIEPGSINFRQFLATQDIVIDGILVSSVWVDVTPVELTSFTASVSENNVTLNWITGTELNNSGFDVLRQAENQQWEKIGFVPGFGTSTEKHSYSFVDENLTSGQYSYRLKQVDFDGSSELSDVVNVEIINPVQYNLSQNFPNPFNPSTTIQYSIPEVSNVTLKVFNTLGEEVSVLVNRIMEAGTYEVNFEASQLHSGIYFYRLDTGTFSQVKKMTILK
ncbi:MAG: T9SS type A sorting domain-containing protein [Draconibacterium sp.]|nr:T9SS type A sorting domain-containing protein [Draconibacterium sp.]